MHVKHNGHHRGRNKIGIYQRVKEYSLSQTRMERAEAMLSITEKWCLKSDMREKRMKQLLEMTLDADKERVLQKLGSK